jgi:adenosylcobinamide kinase/adenosylcobinamide-phosphate guanylyltransferase
MLTLVLGGARSGKSRFAQSLTARSDAVVLVATARASDAEMRERILRHKADRPSNWVTVEEPYEVPRAVREARPVDASVLVDCVTIWLSNLCWEHQAMDPSALEALVLERTRDLAAAAFGRTVVAVSNEVGCGIVPPTPVGRSFRDLQGLANQVLAAESDRVVMMVAGLPLALKGAVDGVSSS